MPLSLVLIVFVNASEVQSPTTAALRRAALEVLGSESDVQVRGYTTPPDDVQLSEAGQQVDAVAEITWQDPRQRRARVHCYIEAWQRFVNRELVFEDQDEVRERGRMLGFAIASMLPSDREKARREDGPDSESQPPKPLLPTIPALQLQDSPAGPNARAGRLAGAIDVTALSRLGVGDKSVDLGVSVAARWFFHRSLSLRLATGLRYGEIQSAQVRSSEVFGSLGLGFQFTNPDPNPRLVFGGRADALITVNTLRHIREAGDIPESQTHAQPAADLLLEGGWYFLSSTALLAAAGGEFGLGHADVVVRGKEVADVPAFRWVGELGVRARF